MPPSSYIAYLIVPYHTYSHSMRTYLHSTHIHTYTHNLPPYLPTYLPTHISKSHKKKKKVHLSQQQIFNLQFSPDPLMPLVFPETVSRSSHIDQRNDLLSERERGDAYGLHTGRIEYLERERTLAATSHEPTNPTKTSRILCSKRLRGFFFSKEDWLGV